MAGIGKGRGPALAACAAGLALVALGGASFAPSPPSADEGFVPQEPPKAAAVVPLAPAEVARPAKVSGGAGKGGQAKKRAVTQPARSRSRPAAPVRLVLPALDISARIAPVSVASQGDLEVPEDPNVLGWWRGGARPGDGWGSVLIDGHVDSATRGIGAFARLRELEPGDPVLTESASGEVRRYRVTGRRQFPKSTLPAGAIFSQDVQERLVLITCGGRFDRDERKYPDNLVVFAVPEDLPR